MRCRAAFLAAIVAAAGVFATTGSATARHDNYPLHPGSHGPRVAALQWLLHGGKPYVFRQVKPTFKPKPNGSLGARTKSADVAMKYRIGYPAKGQCGARTSMLVPATGPLFFAILEGKKTRPACWVALAARRVHAVNTGPTVLAMKVKAYEDRLLRHGIVERPDGSNAGPCISVACGLIPALQSATGAYRAAWCVSTQQTVLKTVGYGTFADDTANVYYAMDYYAARNLVSAKPKIGALVAFITYGADGRTPVPGTGHMGYVVAVQANSFTYIAGNDANRVNEHTIEDGSRPYAFIYLPGLA